MEETHETPMPQGPADTMARGFLITLVLHAIGLPVIGVIGFLIQLTWGGGYAELPGAVMMSAFNFGWAQIPYMIPAAIVVHRRGQPRTRNGMLLATGIGFLVTSACWGLIAVSL